MRQSTGSSSVEILVVLAVLAVLAGAAAPDWVEWRQRARLRGAARDLSLLVAALGNRAAAQGKAHGVVFSTAQADLAWQVVLDGDGDGIRSDDLRSGVDTRLPGADQLATRHPGIMPGLPAGERAPAGSSTPADGVALGRADILAVHPDGTMSTGTVYLHDARGNCIGVRFYGVTGRRRELWKGASEGTWIELTPARAGPL